MHRKNGINMNEWFRTLKASLKGWRITKIFKLGKGRFMFDVFLGIQKIECAMSSYRYMKENFWYISDFVVCECVKDSKIQWN